MRRYLLTVESDEYGLLDGLADLAALIPNTETKWEVRGDEELEIARLTAASVTSREETQ